MHSLRLAMAQINSTVGDLEGNTAKILSLMGDARKLGADIVCFPELAITGYPPEDLLLKPSFIADNLRHLDIVVAASKGICAVVGFVDSKVDIFNAAAVACNGSLAGVYHKMYLPNYGVFDENRYFQAGQEHSIFTLNHVTVGVNICEDIWYPTGPVSLQAFAGAEVILNINSSPYHAGKRQYRHKMLATRAMDNGVIVSYTNMVGSQDELVFDGNSVVFDQEGRMVAEASQFREELLVVDLDVEAVFRSRLHDPRRRKERLLAGQDAKVVRTEMGAPPPSPKPSISPSSPLIFDSVGEIYEALVLGTGDYVRKNGFRKVLIGLSGGVDSSLTAAIAVDALGPENVIGVAMPSRYSSSSSVEDARLLAENLRIRLLTIPIEGAFAASLAMLEEAFSGTEPGIAEENLQARIRGNILMALSNKFGHLVLTTGNKSETATGYCTLYGDMAGGFAVVKDVPKTTVYALGRYRNARAGNDLIPQSVLDKPPSAELRPNQLDSDSLPPYELLDPVLQAYVEEDRGYQEMVDMGMDPELVKRVISLVDSSEYKRRQGPPGVKITPRAFGRDRRLPITNRYRAY